MPRLHHQPALAKAVCFSAESRVSSVVQAAERARVDAVRGVAAVLVVVAVAVTVRAKAATEREAAVRAAADVAAPAAAPV